MYQIVSTLNGIMRDELLPNPFEFISDNEFIVLFFTHLIGTWILHKISFSMCGIFYKRGKLPILGSIGYMFFFSLNVWILITISKYIDSVLIISSIYFIIIIIIFVLLSKIREKVFST